ncbi:MAG: MerR family transcriptional regulator [Proteobacteria bacterium]|nr:MerR family transcriptional regulator [Pseudomonadota bacterium]
MTVSLNDQPGFGIGAVSRLTGIPLDTLRAWERRYSLVNPVRTSANKRSYTRTDVARLKLIKKLVDQGHAISSVAQLSEEALEELMQAHLDPPPGNALGQGRWRALVYGDSLPFLLRQWKNEMAFLDLLGSHQSFAEFESAAMVRKPDVLIMEMPVLRQERLGQLRELIDRSAPKRAVVVYTFGMRNLLEELNRQGVYTLRSPVTVKQLQQVCRAVSGNQSADHVVSGESNGLGGHVPRRRFDSEMLVAVANVTTKIQCECPQHLADLLFRLNAFEAYSADCENRNTQDAALHDHLHQATARARAILEDALDYLIECEEIELDSMASLN